MVYIYLPYGGVYLLQGTGTNEPTSNDKTSNFKAISGSSYTCFGISCDFYVKLKYDVAFAPSRRKQTASRRFVNKLYTNSTLPD